MEADLSNRIGQAAERFVPGQGRGELMEAEHLARYWWASGLVAGRRVLDAGCGMGYGSAMLAQAGAAEVVGIDVAPDAVAAAGRAHPGIEFVAADVHELPFPDDRFDVVVCFEMIEHVDAQDAVIGELARVLADDGVLAISSPNRGVYPPGNPHHRHEYVPDELSAALRARFAHVELHRQHDWLASAVLDDARVGDESLGDLRLEVGKSVGLGPASETYTIALAGQTPPPPMAARAVLAGPDELRRAFALASQTPGLQADLANLQRVETQLREENAILLAELEQVRATLRRIHASALWRLSAPLRGRLRRRS